MIKNESVALGVQIVVPLVVMGGAVIEIFRMLAILYFLTWVVVVFVCPCSKNG